LPLLYPSLASPIGPAVAAQAFLLPLKNALESIPIRHGVNTAGDAPAAWPIVWYAIAGPRTTIFPCAKANVDQGTPRFAAPKRPSVISQINHQPSA